jgi:hypothetical protein
VDDNVLENKADKLRKQLEAGCKDPAVKAEYDRLLSEIREATPVVEKKPRGCRLIRTASFTGVQRVR